MANQLPLGQIVPAARPVSAFIEPQQSNIAAPNAPARLGGNGLQINTINRGGTTNVAGSYNDLAEALAPLNRNVTQALSNLGLAYAGNQIAAGERDAREQVSRAFVNNDSQVEAAELDRAATNRRLGAKDKNAGTLMAQLNPYYSIGLQRGNARLAGESVSLGMPAYFAQHRDQVDFTAPDQGFSGLVKLQAAYTAQLAESYGLSEFSPGFQKYTLPEIERTRDRITTQHIADRKNYFDTIGVQQTAEQIRAVYRSSEASGVVEVAGQTFSRAADPGRFEQMRQYKANSILENLLLRQSLPGEASSRSEDVYKLLIKEADYTLDNGMQSFVDSLPSQQVLKDENGKAVINPATGKPFNLRWGEVYRGVAIESEMRYEEAGLKKRKERMLEDVGGFEEGLLATISSVPPGPAQQQRAEQFTQEWYDKNGRPNGISRVELQKRRAELVKLDDSIYVEGQDPNVESNFFSQLQQSYGSDFNATAQRQQMNDVAAQILDPQRRTSFVERASGDIASREKEMANFAGYNAARNEIVNQAVNTNLASYYDVGQAGSNPRLKANVEESKVRQRSAFTGRANQLIQQEEAKLKRRLTDTEVRQITRAAIYGDPDRNIAPYGSGAGSRGGSGQNQKEYLFPGSRRTDEPDAPGPSGRRPAGQTYGLLELNKIQTRSALRQYKGTAILSADGTLQAWRYVSGNRPLPPTLERAWRDAGASSAAEFVLGQMDVHRRLMSQKGAKAEDLQRFNPSIDQRNQALQRSTRAAAGGNALQGAVSMVQGGMPRLAQLGSVALNALTGTAPAAAGEMPGGPVRLPSGNGGGSSPGGSRPGGGGAGPAPAGGSPGRAPAAPVLPAPSGGQLLASVSAGSRTGANRIVAAAGTGLPAPVGQLRPAPVPGWWIDEAGNFISPTQGRPALDPISQPTPQPMSIEASRAVMGGMLSGGWQQGPAVPGNHPEAGSGYTIPGAKDAHGRPVILSRAGANSLAAMVRDSGGAVRYSDIASGKRSEAKNAEVGGVRGSTHLEGNGMDIHGTSIAWIRKNGAGYGWYVNDYNGTHGGHVEFRPGWSGASGGSGGRDHRTSGYLKRLSYLETRIRNIPNAEGSPGRGYFQAFPPFAKEAIAASGGIDPRDADYGRSAQATWAWIVKHRPSAAEAIRRGDYDIADRILRPTWPSLPGGSQAQPDEVQREARRYLRS